MDLIDRHQSANGATPGCPGSTPQKEMQLRVLLFVFIASKLHDTEPLTMVRGARGMPEPGDRTV